MSGNSNMENSEVKDSEMLPLIYEAVDASSSGIIITDNRLPDNPIVYSNKAFERISGYKSDEVFGRNCRFLQGEENNQAERKILRDAIRKGESIVVEIKNFKKDGKPFWNELIISPIKDDKGNLTHFIGVQNDVTKRKEVEAEVAFHLEDIEKKVEERTAHLRSSEEYLNSIIQTVHESLVVLDPDFNVLTVNIAFLDTFRVSESETIGRKFYDLGNRQWDIEALRTLLETILPTSNPVLDFEVDNDFPKIGHKTMLLNAHQVELEGSYKDRILLAIQDITDRRQIEKRKDDFLSIASHELKTPLTAIKGYIDVIERLISSSDTKLNEITRKADEQVERLTKLINELLDVSKIQSGKLDLHREKFDFDQMIRDTVEHIQLNNQDYSITVKGSTGIAYDGDESHLSQVISNLLSNSIKYSPADDRIEIILSNTDSEIRVDVKDYGIGISDEDKQNIFDRFYRVGDVQKSFAGMGIGLYICEQIIRQHEGHLWVDSELQKGSTFSFTLPINN